MGMGAEHTAVVRRETTIKVECGPISIEVLSTSPDTYRLYLSPLCRHNHDAVLIRETEALAVLEALRATIAEVIRHKTMQATSEVISAKVPR